MLAKTTKTFQISKLNEFVEDSKKQPEGNIDKYLSNLRTHLQTYATKS